MYTLKRTLFPQSKRLAYSPYHLPPLHSFSTTTDTNTNTNTNTHSKLNHTPFLSKDNFTAPTDISPRSYRWRMVLPAFLTHMCIGSPFGWSAVSSSLSQEIGFVAPVAADWTFAQVAFPISIVFAMQGLAAAGGGKWQMKVGERVSGGLSAFLFGGGLLVGSAGIYMHSLSLLYLGYGVLAGTGVGLGYTPPISTLVQWFPDRKGLASGMTIAGFGSGALLFAPVMSLLAEKFAVIPTFVGKLGDHELVSEGGRLFVSLDNNNVMSEVVIAGASDIARLPSGYGLSEGLYMVGTGSTGMAPALAVCGMGYLLVMLGSAFTLRKPHISMHNELMGGVANNNSNDTNTNTNSDNNGNSDNNVQEKTHENVHVDSVMKTPQFKLLGFSFFCLASGGIGLFSVAKPMMSEVFGGSLPALVTASFASSYVLMLSVANLSGRLGWSAFSDRFGRRNTFHLFTIGSIPLYLAMPYLVSSVVSDHASLPLYAFIGSTFLAVSAMGGAYALLPAYEADLFGSKYLAANHGRMLLASTAAALGGPSLLLTLRRLSEERALAQLLAVVDPVKFEQSFGVAVERAPELVEAKTLTIGKLMQVVPPDIVDPSPFLYNTTMYTLAGLMAAASVSHAFVRPVDPKYFEVLETEKPVKLVK